MVLLFVPIALISPQLSRVWLIPILPGIVTALSYVVVPGAVDVGAFSADTLRTTLPWLTAELATAVALCTTAEQRSALWARRSRRDPREQVPRTSRLGADRIGS